uniref:Uncharacterized protein n=1 Tax=Anopheles dirus TaxID=7168 RepID=A0A182NU72_9DIPT
MDNVFHQTDETFYETQYSKGFPSHPPTGEGTTVASSVRPASANDAGLQMKRLLETETDKPKEQLYRERWHQLHRSKEEQVGGQKFLRTVDSLASVKHLTHGAKSQVENNFSNILFPGRDGEPDSKTFPDKGGDSRSHTMTHGKRTNSDRSGGCVWKIFNHESSPTPPALPPARRGVATMKNEHAAGKTLQRCPSAPCRTYNTITQEADHQDAPGINKALQYLHKLRTLLSHTGAVQRTRKEMIRYEIEREGTVQCGSDWNGMLLRQIGTGGTLDYGLLEPLLRKLNIGLVERDGFAKFLDLLDSEVSLTRFELGKHMQQSLE